MASGMVSGVTIVMAGGATPSDIASLGNQGTSVNYARRDHTHKGVAKIIAGTNISITPASGTGTVTVSGTSAGGGVTSLNALTGALSLVNGGGITITPSGTNITLTNTLISGLAGGQTVIGGTASGNNLTLQSTSHATKGKILFGTSGYDEVNNRLGIGTASPTNKVHILGSGNTFPIVETNTGGAGWLLKVGATSSYIWFNGTHTIITNTAGAGHLLVDQNGGVTIGETEVNIRFIFNSLNRTLTIQGGVSAGQGNIIFNTTDTASYNANLLMLGATSQSLGFIAGTTAIFNTSNGPFFGARGNTYTAVATQRGILFFSAGSPTTPVAGEGEIRLYSGTTNIIRQVIDRNGNLFFGYSLTQGTDYSGSGKGVFAMTIADTNPSSTPANTYIQYGADVVAGNTAPHFRTEAGDIVKLFKGAAVADASGGTVIDAEARTAINSFLSRFRVTGGNGLIAD